MTFILKHFVLCSGSEQFFLFLLKPSCLSIRIVVMDELHACPPIKMNASSQITYKFMNARQRFRQDLGTICGSFPAPA